MATAMPTSPTAGDGDGLRRRPVAYDWRADGAAGGEGEVVFEEEALPKWREYLGIACDYVFWISIAYCAMSAALWLGEYLGFLSPQMEEWSPTRWFHPSPDVLQRELFERHSASEATAEQFGGLRTWIESGPGGWVSPKLTVSDYLSEHGRYDRRLEVTREVLKDEVLIKLPLSHVLSSDFCRADPDETIQQISVAQQRSSEQIEVAAWTWIVLYMITHSRNVERGTAGLVGWRFDNIMGDEYIDAALSFVPIFWDDDTLQWLNGTDLLSIHVLDVHAAIESEYQKLVYLLARLEKEVPLIEFKKWSMVVMSRGETVELPGKDDPSQTVPQLAIMPLIDLVDHHLPMPERPLFTDDDLREYQEKGSHTNTSYNTDLAAVVLRARVGLPANTPVTAGYGVRSNSDYLLYHGFTMPYLWSDLTLCTQYAMFELPLPADMPKWKASFLPHAYRFSVPVCPYWKSTPHVLIAAARFLVASEQDIVGFRERVAKDPSLLEGGAHLGTSTFMQSGVREALGAVCDIGVEPPICRSPLSVESEKAAWAFVRQQTLARIAQHKLPVSMDDQILREDEAQSHLTINQRHAVVVRREEKLVLQHWCAVVVHISDFLSSALGAEEAAIIRLPDSQRLENDEPRVRPKYWARLFERSDGDPPSICMAR